jgi:DNA-binding CsgD family transcriptional regulator
MTRQFGCCPRAVQEHRSNGREQGCADGNQGDLPAGHAARGNGMDPGTGRRYWRVLVPAGRTGRELLGERGGPAAANASRAPASPARAPDFSERDRAVLILLRPHLNQAYLDTERRCRPVPRLTPRQTGLLRLVAAGHTNTQIARRLGISEGTVRTHLENIYGRLQVSSRTAAVTRAFPDRVA